MSGEPPAIPDYVATEADLSSDQYNDEIVTVMRWLIENAPRGPQGSASTTSSSSSTTTTTVDAGLSITFTAVVGRKYEHRISAHWLATIADTLVAIIITDGSNTVLATFDAVMSSANIADHRYIEWTESPASGSTTRKIRVKREVGSVGAGNVQRFADSTRPSTYEIRDVGAA